LSSYLFYSLVKREISGRYRGSTLGLLWAFLSPLLMLAVYTFCFSVIFKARWHTGGDSKIEFALQLFCGLIVFNLFSETVNRAPYLILSNVNYVKKVVFPLEILPCVTLGAAFFHFVISVLVWLIFWIASFGMPPLSIWQLPLVILPLILWTLGLSWFLASLGVYLRDIGQVIGVATAALMFVTPVFYPITALPEQYHAYLLLSPLTSIVEQSRGVMILGNSLVLSDWLWGLAKSALVCVLGYMWFQKTRKGFADIV
jgi:lipopolysaccharide transport system permease protein